MYSTLRRLFAYLLVIDVVVSGDSRFGWYGQKPVQTLTMMCQAMGVGFVESMMMMMRSPGSHVCNGPWAKWWYVHQLSLWSWAEYASSCIFLRSVDNRNNGQNNNSSELVMIASWARTRTPSIPSVGHLVKMHCVAQQQLGVGSDKTILVTPHAASSTFFEISSV